MYTFLFVSLFVVIVILQGLLWSKQSDLYLQRLNEELSQIEQHHLKTIYIGGGTPSALNDEQLEKLMSMLKTYSLEVEEYCMEVNPESMDYYKLKILKKVVLIV